MCNSCTISESGLFAQCCADNCSQRLHCSLGVDCFLWKVCVTTSHCYNWRLCSFAAIYQGGIFIAPLQHSIKVSSCGDCVCARCVFLYPLAHTCTSCRESIERWLVGQNGWVRALTCIHPSHTLTLFIHLPPIVRRVDPPGDDQKSLIMRERATQQALRWGKATDECARECCGERGSAAEIEFRYETRRVMGPRVKNYITQNAYESSYFSSLVHWASRMDDPLLIIQKCLRLCLCAVTSETASVAWKLRRKMLPDCVYFLLILSQRRLLIGSHLVKFLKHAVIKTRFTSQIWSLIGPFLMFCSCLQCMSFLVKKLYNYLCGNIMC